MALRHNQRVTADIVPMEETDEDEPDSTIQPLMMLKRNLISDFGRPSVLEPPVPSEHMPVYLRIRPFSKDETERNEDQGCYIVESDKTVVTHPPKDSHFFKNMTRGLCKSTTKYTFSQIFNENTSQKDFFNSTMLNYVKDFIDGQNCLVFSYGVTSSGKTYTIQGNPKDAGILPRALDVLFNSIHGKQWNGMDLKPQMFTEVVRLSPEQEQHEKRMKEATLKLSLDDDMDVMSLLGDDASDISSATNSTACSEGSNMSSLAGKEFMDCSQQLFLDLEQRVREEGKVSVDEQGQVKFSVWVSFAEIYNEQIYDLLVPIAKKKNARRPCLKLSEDKHGSPYIKDLKYIHVGSADEAYKLLTIGQRNLQKACTKMNQNSSRSHCIFNIKILRVIDKDNPHVARVSMLTLCDLAGSERYSKTQNTGDRLKEAGNINTSLLTLGRCIETLRYNQAHKDQQRIIPFRESKLTRLFQNNFSGRGKAAMIVNVNQLSTMFDETMHVFKFSAIASKVEVQQKPVFIKPKMPIAAAPSLIPRTSISWATPARNHGLKQHEAENVPLPDDSDLEEEEEEEKTYTQENIDELLEIIEQLQGDLQSEVHTRWKLEKQIRTEVCAEMMRQFSQIEEEHSERIRQREVRAEELNEKRIQIILNAERSRRQALEATNDGEEEWVSSVYLHQERLKNEQKDSTIRELRQEIERLTSQSVGAVTEGSEKPKGLELDTQLKEQLAKIEEERQAAESLRRQLQEYTDHITKLEQKLAQATSAKASMSELEEKLAEYEATIKALQCEMAQKAVKDAGSGDDHLMDNLTHQLQQARDKVKEQEDEMVELNDMLREAGETFTLKEAEIERLKQLTAQYEQQLEDQREAIKVLERAASDGKTAMELADQSLSKREECVSTLQAEIRGLEGDVTKYRNKARFFEDQLVEKEQQADYWRTKYEHDVEEHTRSQDALIHGFNAEIANLKSQIFHFKAQLYGCKSPSKSPCGPIKSPDLKMKLFPKSPFSPSTRAKNQVIETVNDLNKSHNLNEHVDAVQKELNQNCKMILELEAALKSSRLTINDLEKKLEQATCYSNIESKMNNLNDLEKKLEQDTCYSNIESKMNNLNEKYSVAEKDAEINALKTKIEELEPLMKDYFSSSKRLTESEHEVKSLHEQLEKKVEQINKHEENILILENEVCLLKKELSIVKFSQEKQTDVHMLLSDKNGIDGKHSTQTEKPNNGNTSPIESVTITHVITSESVQDELAIKSKELEHLNEQLILLKAKIYSKEIALKETAERCMELEFKSNEKEIEYTDLEEKLEEKEKKIIDLDSSRLGKITLLQETGEELAVLELEYGKAKRQNDELKATITDLQNAIVLKEQELISQDNRLADKDLTINELQTKLKKVTESQASFDEPEKVRNELNRLQETVNSLNEKMQDSSSYYSSVEKELIKAKYEHADKEKLLIEKDIAKSAAENEVKILRTKLNELNTHMANIELELENKDIEHSSLLNSFNSLKELNTQNELVSVKLHDALLEITDLKSSVNNYKSLHHKVKGELEEALLTIENNRHELACFKKETAQLKGSFTTHGETEQIEHMKKAVIELEQDLLGKDDAANKINIELNATKQQYEQMKQNFDKVKCDNESKELEISNLKHQIHEADSKTGCDLEKARMLYNEKLQKINDLEQKLCEFDNIKQQNIRFAFEVNDQKDKLLMQEELLDKNREMVKKLEDLLAKAREQNEDSVMFEINLTKMEEKLDETEVKLGKAQAKLFEAKTKVNELEEKLRYIEFKLQEQNALNVVEKEKTISLEIKLRTKDEEISELRKELESFIDYKQTTNDLGGKLLELQTKFDTQSTEITCQGEKFATVCTQFRKIWVQIGHSEYAENSFDCLDACIDEICEYIEQLRKEKKSCEEKLKALNMQIETVKLEKNVNEEDRQKEIKTLRTELSNLETEIIKLQEENKKAKNNEKIENEFKSQLSLKEVECETLSLELKMIKEEFTTEKLKGEIVLNNKETVNDISMNKVCISDNSDKVCDKFMNEKIAELNRLYESEKCKNEEYKRVLAETSEANISSPHTGIRKLRIQKIETENALVEAKFKVTCLEKKVVELETKLKNKSIEHRDLVAADPIQERKLKSVTSKLEETEEENKELMKRVTQLQGDVAQLEQELRDGQARSAVESEMETPRRSRASFISAGSRLSVSSPVSKLELTRAREREQRLKDQLSEMTGKTKEWLDKMAETETKLQLRCQELAHARDTIDRLQTHSSEEHEVDKQLRECLEQNNELKLQILRKEGDLETKNILIKNLHGQLDSEMGILKSYQREKQEQCEMIELLKETLQDQEAMLEEQGDFIVTKETQIQQLQAECDELQRKCASQAGVGEAPKGDCKASVRAQADSSMLRQQLTDLETKVSLSMETQASLTANLTEARRQVKDTEKLLGKMTEERDQLTAVLRENNAELKAMECALTESRKELEELRGQSHSKLTAACLQEVKNEADKHSHDLQGLQCHNKELDFQLRASGEKLAAMMEEKATLEKRLKEFREERDKLVSGLETVLKKKDSEIKQLKEVIRTLKEKEIHITQSWEDEREKIASGLEEINKADSVKVKEEPPTLLSPSHTQNDAGDSSETQRRQRSRSRQACSYPPRQQETKVQEELQVTRVQEDAITEIQTLERSPSSARPGSQAQMEGSAGSTGRPPRASRRGKKRPSSEGLDNVIPEPKRQSRDDVAETSAVSESEDYSSHLQVDATPPVAAKTLRRTRKKNGSIVDLSKNEENKDPAMSGQRSQKRMKNRLLQSFRESPMGKTSKRILDSIAETFSPQKSPQNSPLKSPLRQDNSERSRSVAEDTSNHGDKKASRGRGKHKLYREETYISEPLNNTREFVQSPPDVHKSVTRSLRSRRH
ncbi:kinesin-like protein KIF20B isoform X2 [Dreissena polymorpha]|uniref:kinesin-like protein KIF20B isoform X2 n=1 Tax=Dreissena polymorpha TaxID=45954 RepID=UPI00226469FB|nr:kinesin-like protein KIF20B isoform X2 [Dreissena polymorpha]